MKVSFYWDDQSSIKAYANEPFCLYSTLKIFNDSIQLDYKLEIISEFCIKLILYENYDFKGDYHVEYLNKKYLIEERMIVQSEWFDENMVPDIKTLGSFYSKEKTVFRVWAPLSKETTLVLNNQEFKMYQCDKGVYEYVAIGDYEKSPYYYLLEYNKEIKKCIDPFAYSSGVNESCSFVLDKDKFIKDRYKPLNKMNSYCDAIIYETSVRDFSIDSYFKHQGTFKGMIEKRSLEDKTIGLDYLIELGITHLQLMPVFDFGSVDEVKKDSYNWGYDPVQYNVVEGTYVNEIDNPYARVNELIELINVMHQNNIRVNLDVVFNHVYKLYRFSLNILCPYYFFRYDDMKLSDGSFCGNEIRSESRFMRSYILEMIKRYIDIYDIDGLRFDLMSLIDTETINEAVKLSLSEKEEFMIYGEGWQMPSVLPAYMQSSIVNAGVLKKVAFFNPTFRDNVRGSNYLDSSESFGYAFGNVNGGEVMKRLLIGDKYGGFSFPHQSINYVECHDNFTFFDKMKYNCPDDDERLNIKKAKLAIGLIMLSQGVPFLHSGQEFLRTKKGADNSYNLPDEVNHLDWKRKNRYLELVNYTKEMIDFRKKHDFLRLDDYEEIVSISSFENYYEVLVYNIANLKILINPCPFYHLYDIEGEYRMIYNENGYDDVIISRCAGVPEFSIVILEKI